MRGYPVYAMGPTDEPVWSRNEQSLSRGVSHQTMVQPISSAYPTSYSHSQAYPSQTTVIHSTTKPVADADIYRYDFIKKTIDMFL